MATKHMRAMDELAKLIAAGSRKKKAAKPPKTTLAAAPPLFPPIRMQLTK